MARLPRPGGDNGNWGTILNDYLLVEHDTAGYLKPGVVGSTQIANDAIMAAHVADNTFPQAKIQNLVNNLAAKADASNVYTKTEVDTVVAPKYEKPGGGIPKSDLSAAVQASLDKADTAQQTAPPAGASGSLSGFPLRKAGERAVALPMELGNAYPSAASPSGSKIVVLAESWDKPGILKHVWFACGNTTDGSGFGVRGGVIRIYTDNDTTPAVSMTLGDFFCCANQDDIYATPRIGRTTRGGDQSSGYRYLHMPFQKYLRVEVENLTNSNTVFYGTADYTTVDSFADLGSQQLAYSIRGQRVASQPKETPLTVCDFNGAGQIESLWLSMGGATGDDGVMEGNVEIFVDGETFPSWSSSGTEDAFNGGWYNVPKGGYPAGRPGDSNETGVKHAFYRFFVDDPIFYTSHLKVVIWAGQSQQGSISSATVELAGYVGVWSNTPVTPNYQAVDTVASPILQDNMNDSAGALSSSTWNQDGSRTQAVATGSTITVPYGNAGPDQDVRIARKNVTLPSDYWIETRVRITDALNDDQQAHLIMLGASPDPYFGSAVHIQLWRHQQKNWSITARDDFDTTLLTTIGSGRDLTNVWVRIALKKQGSQVTAYYSLNDAPAPWAVLGTWTTGKTGSAFGIGTWTAGAEFDSLVVRPLATTTS